MRPFIAGNWKMNLARAAAVELAQALAAKAGEYSGVDIAVCPPSVYLEAVRGAIGNSAVGLGAQNCHHEAKGAFTGEIAPQMLVDLGCKYVILGHSERRHIFKETSGDVSKKVTAALAAGLTPIVCLGELRQERQAGRTKAVVTEQLDGSLAGLSADQVARIVLAYEPVWAIGTGVVATPQQAEEVHADLRNLLADRYNSQVASQVRIQYGGSVTAENAGSLLSQPNIDGALVGGASLKAESFLGILAAARK
jgi:triosephosphate isomerase